MECNNLFNRKALSFILNFNFYWRHNFIFLLLEYSEHTVEYLIFDVELIVDIDPIGIDLIGDVFDKIINFIPFMVPRRFVVPPTIAPA